ncbi:MAG: universal stress protein [Micavibrio sp.]|nr:universal stress protein [Micavibrio sp.]
MGNEIEEKVAGTDMGDKGGVYLLVADESSEFQLALRSASDLAYNNKAQLALVYVAEPVGFQQWGAVEDKIIAEQTRKGEGIMRAAAKVLSDMHGHAPTFHVRQGKAQEEIVSLMEETPDIRALILGASRSSNPLISYFCGKGLSNLSVPLFIIPEN